MKLDKKTSRRILKAKIHKREIEQAMAEFQSRASRRRVLSLAEPAEPQSPGGTSTAAARTAIAAETGQQKPLSAWLP